MWTIITPWFLRRFAGKGVRAMALFPFVLLREKALRQDDQLLNHEEIHLVQQKEMLIVFFYLVYGYYYLRGRVEGKSATQAYLDIPFEKEAYQNDNNLDYLSHRPFWAWIKY